MDGGAHGTSQRNIAWFRRLPTYTGPRACHGAQFNSARQERGPCATSLPPEVSGQICGWKPRPGGWKPRSGGWKSQLNVTQWFPGVPTYTALDLLPSRRQCSTQKEIAAPAPPPSLPPEASVPICGWKPRYGGWKPRHVAGSLALVAQTSSKSKCVEACLPGTLDRSAVHSCKATRAAELAKKAGKPPQPPSPTPGCCPGTSPASRSARPRYRPSSSPARPRRMRGRRCSPA